MGKINVITKSCRSVTLEICNGKAYYSEEVYNVYLNKKQVLKKQKKNVLSLYDLVPETLYTIEIENENKEMIGTTQIITEAEYVRLNVKKFGAVGDGETEDTMALQAAIYSCPDGGSVYIPKGTYISAPLFLRSHITIVFEEGATLLGITDRRKYPVLPGYTISEDEQREYYLGTWEGNPLDTMASLITGINVENVKIIGKGIVDGNAQNGDWWIDIKKKVRGWRPRTIFLNGCKDIEIQGITVKNSPSWTIHPYFSENLKFIDMEIINPSNSPNTDGINPESCKNVEIIGTKISVGDDCIAIKSGKLFMGQKFKRPSENITIRNCMMERGHGAIVFGSEISGGVKDIFVSECLFIHTDRGIRIKTRRGRGKDCIIDGITLKNIKMNSVKTPLVINMFYFCDPDGKSEYVWSKEPLPVDEWTPTIGHLSFKDMICEDCQVAATFFYGLPENPIGTIEMENIAFTFREGETRKDTPAMMSFLEPVCKMGIFAKNVGALRLRNVTLQGYEGEPIITENIQELINE